MENVDPTQAFLLVEPRSQLARDAFGLRENAGVLVQPKQIRQPVNIAPSGTASEVTYDTASEIALQLRFDRKPIDPTAGYVFGSSEKDCDVLLDTVSNRGVSSMAFNIKHHRLNQDLNLNCLAHKGIFFRENTEDLQLRRLLPGSSICLQPGHTWIIVLGNIQIALTAVTRDHSQQQAYDRNLKDYMRNLAKAVPDVAKLKVHASATSTMDTPDTRVLQGVWGNYTTTRGVGFGGMGTITGCISKTGVTCCIKEANPNIRQEFLRREIDCLRSLAHPSIVQYIDRDKNFTWVAMELVKMGNLQQQHDKKPFTMREIEVLTYQALDALSHVHSLGILHHDIKLTNILVQIRTENQILVKLADFGISVTASKHPDTPMGLPSFLAPECFKQRPKFWDVEIDVWALAMVALSLLFGFPFPMTASSDYGPKSPYAEGWGGALKAHFDKNAAEYRGNKPGVSDPFFQTLTRMFEFDPKARIRALEACQNLRKDYPPGYFLSLGTGARTPAIIEPILPTDTRSDDDSIFRFRELDVEGLSKPLLMLERCYLVNLQQILEAKFKGKVDMEIETYKVLERLEHRYWRFKRTNQLPETYIRIEGALELCKRDKSVQSLVGFLQKQQALCDDAMAGFSGREENADKRSDSEGPSTPQLALIDNISTSDKVIAINEEGRMLLVRAKDGYIHAPSIRAVMAKKLLLEDEAKDESYMPLHGAMLLPNIMSHDDIVSLGAAPYSCY